MFIVFAFVLLLKSCFFYSLAAVLLFHVSCFFLYSLVLIPKFTFVLIVHTCVSLMSHCAACPHFSASPWSFSQLYVRVSLSSPFPVILHIFLPVIQNFDSPARLFGVFGDPVLADNKGLLIRSTGVLYPWSIAVVQHGRKLHKTNDQYHLFWLSEVVLSTKNPKKPPPSR